jgi:hypothetical protein
MDLSPGHSSIVEIISHCDLGMVREAFMDWIHYLQPDWPFKPGMRRDMELLLEKAGGICFLRSVPYSRQLYSPLSVAMQTSQSSTKIRELLQNSPFQIEQLVREEIQLCSNGWTEETLMALFDEGVERCTGPGQFTCKTCGFWQASLYSHREYPWERSLRRLKRSIHQDLPPDETKIRREKIWGEVVANFQAEICLVCQKRVPNFYGYPTPAGEDFENDSVDDHATLDPECLEDDSDDVAQLGLSNTTLLLVKIL